jgi:hypothetical protein
MDLSLLNKWARGKGMVGDNHKFDVEYKEGSILELVSNEA